MIPAAQVLAGGGQTAHLTERFQQTVIAQSHQDGVRLFQLFLMEITGQHDIAVIKLLQRPLCWGPGQRSPEEAAGIASPAVTIEADWTNLLRETLSEELTGHSPTAAMSCCCESDSAASGNGTSYLQIRPAFAGQICSSRFPLH